jgi:hypothetical protein
MTINITMKNEKNKYGYLANVPAGQRGNSTQASGIGASGQTVLINLFGHQNKFLGTPDDAIAANFLKGRGYIAPLTFSISEIDAAIAVIESKMEARLDVLVAANPNDDGQGDDIYQNLQEDKTLLQAQKVDQQNNVDGQALTIEELEALAEGESPSLSAYNPDFLPSSFSYSYAANIPADSSRANDLAGLGRNSATSSSPNLNYPALNPNYDSWEVESNDTTDVRSPAQNRGGFGPSLAITHSTGIINAIISKYTATAP